MPAYLADPYFLVCATIAVSITGVIRGGFGSGIGGLAVPIMSLAVAPQQAAAIALPILIASDVFGFYLYRMNLQARIMKIIIPGGLAGTVLGWWLFRSLDEAWIKLILGIISILFVLHSVVKRDAPRRPAGPLAGLVWSTAAGITSFIAHSGAPPMVMYLLSQRLAKEVFVSTSLTFFMLLNLSKIGPYLELGILDRDAFLTALALIPILWLGILVGKQLHKRITPTWFFRAIVIMLLLTGLKLTWDGASGLVGRF